jgi:hypothetical protein
MLGDIRHWTAAGTGPGVYTFGWTSTVRTWAQYDAISN